MNYLTILLVIAAIATSHCLFLAASLFLLNTKLTNRLLAIILLLLALRTGKSVSSLIFPESAYVVSVVGLFSMAMLGPLVFLFIKGLFANQTRLDRWSLIQLLPSLSALVLFPVFNWAWMTILYYFFTAHLLLYLVVAGKHLFENQEVYQVDDLKWKWAWMVLPGMMLIWIGFLVQMIFYERMTYTLNVVGTAIVVYLLSLSAMSKSRLFAVEPKKKAGTPDLTDELAIRIQSLFEQEEVFIDPGLNITKLADKLKSPPYLVSKAINHFFKKSFSELVVGYRIKKSEQFLLSRSQILSIEGIAYESGFNSLSAFYTAFKKINKMTPAQFRNGKGSVSMKIA